jgi:hypothetical protein
MVFFETDADLSDEEMIGALQAIADFLKQHSEFKYAQIRLNRLFAGDEVTAPRDRNTSVKVERGAGSRWTVSVQSAPLTRGLSALLDGRF